jgi:hypothetical protein
LLSWRHNGCPRTDENNRSSVHNKTLKPASAIRIPRIWIMVDISLLVFEAGTAPNGSRAARASAFRCTRAFPDVQSFVKSGCSIVLRAGKPSDDSMLSALRNGLLLASRDL